MAEPSPSPERQLLKLIENAGSGEEERQRRRRRAGFVSFAALQGLAAGWASFWKRSLRPAKTRPATAALRQPGLRIGLAGANRILLAVCLAMGFYVIGDTVASSMQLRQPPSLAARPQSVPPAGDLKAGTSVQEAAYYLQKVSSRDIFKGEPVRTVEKKTAAAPAEPPAATKNLSLVGISWSNSPDVIIEDKELKRTYFVKRGQTVGDGVRVEAIYKDRVVLSHEGTEFELR